MATAVWTDEQFVCMSFVHGGPGFHGNVHLRELAAVTIDDQLCHPLTQNGALGGGRGGGEMAEGDSRQSAQPLSYQV